MTKIKVTSAIFAITGLLLAGTAIASAKNNEPKPGWGFGDENHVHVGPPGQSVGVNPTGN